MPGASVRYSRGASAGVSTGPLRLLHLVPFGAHDPKIARLALRLELLRPHHRALTERGRALVEVAPPGHPGRRCSFWRATSANAAASPEPMKSLAPLTALAPLTCSGRHHAGPRASRPYNLYARRQTLIRCPDGT